MHAYLQQQWPNPEFAANWTVPVVHPSVVAHYGLRHWHEYTAFGVDLSVLVAFNPSPSADPDTLHRWAVINFQKRLIGFFECALGDTDLNFDDPVEMEPLPNGAYQCQRTQFQIEPLPIEWLVAFKRVRWPGIALVLASHWNTAKFLLPSDSYHTAGRIIRRSLAPPQAEPTLFKFKPHQLTPPFLPAPERRRGNEF